MGESLAVFAAVVAGAFTFGMVIVLLGCVKPQLAGQLGVAERRVAGLWALMNGVLVPALFGAGLLIDLWDVRWVFLLGSLLIGLSLVQLLWAENLIQARLAFVSTGLGGGFLSAASLVLMPRAFFGPHEASASVNMGSVFFALGALVAPALAEVLVRTGGLGRALRLTGLLALLTGVLILFVGKDLLGPPQQRPEIWPVLFDPVVLLAGLVFFLYAPLEGCLHTWGSAYLQESGHDEAGARRLITGFWVFFLLGRLAVAFLQHWRWLSVHWDPVVIIALAFLSAVMIGNMHGTVRRGRATTGFLILGFCLGPIFPTLVGFLFSIPELAGAPGTSLGALFVIGSAGSVFFGPIINARYHRKSAQAALRIPLALSILLMVVSLVFAFARA